MGQGHIRVGMTHEGNPARMCYPASKEESTPAHGIAVLPIKKRFLKARGQTFPKDISQ